MKRQSSEPTPLSTTEIIFKKPSKRARTQASEMENQSRNEVKVEKKKKKSVVSWDARVKGEGPVPRTLTKMEQMEQVLTMQKVCIQYSSFLNFVD